MFYSDFPFISLSLFLCLPLSLLSPFAMSPIHPPASHQLSFNPSHRPFPFYSVLSASLPLSLLSLFHLWSFSFSHIFSSPYSLSLTSLSSCLYSSFLTLLSPSLYRILTLFSFLLPFPIPIITLSSAFHPCLLFILFSPFFIYYLLSTFLPFNLIILLLLSPSFPPSSLLHPLFLSPSFPLWSSLPATEEQLWECTWVCVGACSVITLIAYWHTLASWICYLIYPTWYDAPFTLNLFIYFFLFFFLSCFDFWVIVFFLLFFKFVFISYFVLLVCNWFLILIFFFSLI